MDSGDANRIANEPTELTAATKGLIRVVKGLMVVLLLDPTLKGAMDDEVDTAVAKAKELMGGRAVEADGPK